MPFCPPTPKAQTAQNIKNLEKKTILYIYEKLPKKRPLVKNEFFLSYFSSVLIFPLKC